MERNKWREIRRGAEAWARRHWRTGLRLRGQVRFNEEALHVVLAGVVGVIGALVNLGFHRAIDLVELVFVGRVGDPADLAAAATYWQRLLIPTAGGLVAGWVLYFGLRLVGKQGSTDLLEVVVASDGRLPFRTGVIKAVASLISIGSGASIGREGAITQLAAMVASKWGQLAGWPPYRLRLLVACGAASGIAAAYNAPIAGAVFAALIVLGNFSMHLFAPVVFASVIASVMSRSFFGLKPWYVVPPHEFTSLGKLPGFVVVGLVTGVLGALFLRALAAGAAAFKQLALPLYTRVMLGGLAVGLLAMPVPGVWGNGAGVTNQLLQGEYRMYLSPVLYLGLLFAAKFLATTAAVGSGAVGGVFTPTLFLGATAGCMFGTMLHQLGWGLELPVSVFGVVGMGGMLAATTRSPLLAMIMVYEISLNYSLMPPLMLACVVSSLVSRRFHAESIYSQPLRDKGLLVNRERLQGGAATGQTVGDLLRPPVPPLRDTDTLREIAGRFLTNSNNFLPVVNADGQLLGLVALQDLKEYLNAGSELAAVIAYDVMRPVPVRVTPDQSLLEVLPALLGSEQRQVPVVNTLGDNRLIGSVNRSEVLGLLSEAIAARQDGGGGVDAG